MDSKSEVNDRHHCSKKQARTDSRIRPSYRMIQPKVSWCEAPKGHDTARYENTRRWYSNLGTIMRHLVMRFNGLDWEVLTGEVLGLNADMPKLVAALSIAAIEW